MTTGIIIQINQSNMPIEYATTGSTVSSIDQADIFATQAAADTRVGQLTISYNGSTFVFLNATR